jgi:ATP-binding cassette subfamily B protein
MAGHNSLSGMQPKDNPVSSQAPSAWITDLSRQARFYPRALRLIWAATHRLTLIWVVLLIVQGLLPVATIYATKKLVDGLVGAAGTGFDWAHLGAVATPALFMAGLLLLGELLQAGLEWVRAYQAEYVQDHIADLIHTQSVTVDLAFYETPEYFDHLQRAQGDGSARSLALLENTGSLLQGSLTLLAMAAVLVGYTPWLPLILIFGTLPALITVFRANRRYHRWWKHTTTDRRWAQYYELLLTHNGVAAELRLFGLGPSFQLAYRSIRRRLRTERLRLLRDQNLARLAAGVLALLTTGIALAWVGRGVVKGALTLGDVALFYQAYTRGQGLLQALLGNIGQIYSNSLFLSDLFEFLELKPQVLDCHEPIAPPVPLKSGIRLRRLAFRYPGTRRDIFQGLDLTFPAGKITAIVGENGAGKSTLVKLICRFYDPTEGCIELDGVDLRAIALAELRRMISVLFQLPVPFTATAAQNIAMGDLQTQPGRVEVAAAARDAGADHIISHLPAGYDTLLGRMFPGGVELSVGEWQRIALARAFLRRAPIIILDEPTSAMDPWAEADWMSRFQTLVAGQTAIIITHRFTTARHADIIHVMRGGEIVESGSHEDLLMRRGMYATSWSTQMLGVEANRPAQASSFLSTSP